MASLAQASAAQAAAAPVTFGPDLNTLTDSNSVGCETDPILESPTNASSCTWSSDVATSESNTTGGQLPPTGSGTVSQVTIKVGPVTGPMQVTVLQQEAEYIEVGTPNVHPRISCCTAVDESQVFTPRANATTTERVNLPVEVEETPNAQTNIQTADSLGLSVLEDGVPVPAANDRTATPLEQPVTVVEQPALTKTGQQQTADEGSGYMVLMDALWNPSAGSSAPEEAKPEAKPTAHAPATAIPKLTFHAGKFASIKGSDALIDLACATAPCKGTVRLQSAPAGKTAAAAPTAKGKAKTKTHRAAVVTYASGSFSLAAGKSQAIAAKLSSAGRKQAREHKRLKVWVNVTLTNVTPTKVASRAVTLSF